ncbi:MAG TPA: Holliday junction resolvase RuvX [Opitutales bacterium]|nr:Holliday junction resolvase RuvX [Opitutales bacterium]
MRFLGIDYGAKRWGLSYGDELALAVPLAAAVAGAKEERFAQVAQEISRRKITALVVGYPYNMDGTAGPKAREVDGFIAELEKRFKLPVHRSDERLTSHQAEAELRQKKSRRSPAAQRAARATGEVDSRAATLILQDFLDAHHGPALLPEE